MLTPGKPASSARVEFDELMERIAAGDEDAAWQLVESYGSHVLRAVRRSLHLKVRQQFDSTDFVQAVWASLFLARDRLEDVKQPEQLIALLAAMARNKVIDVVRQRTATQKYNVDREVSVDREGTPVVASVASKDPTPSEFAVARERWDELLRNQPEHYRKIVEMRLKGASYRDIAGQLKVSDKTIQRVLARLFEEKVA